MTQPTSVRNFEILMSYLDDMLTSRVDLQKQYDRMMRLWPKVAPVHLLVPTESIQVGAVLNKKAAQDCGLRDALWQVYFGIRGVDVMGNKIIPLDFQDVFNRDYLDQRLQLDRNFRYEYLDDHQGTMKLFKHCRGKLEGILERESEFCTKYYKDQSVKVFARTMGHLFARQVALFGQNKDPDAEKQQRENMLTCYQYIKKLQRDHRCLSGFSLLDYVDDKKALMHFFDMSETRKEFNEMARKTADAALIAPRRTFIRPLQPKRPPL